MVGGGGVQDEQKLIARQGVVSLIIGQVGLGKIGQVGLGKAREEKICCQTPLKAWRGLVLLVPVTSNDIVLGIFPSHYEDLIELPT